LDIEVLNNLENKVSALLNVLESVRLENATLKKELEEKGSLISSVETENGDLKRELNQLKQATSSQQEKLNLTTEKIQGILARLEMVQ
jgi:FtsZ-binding cell division protein ZapB